MTMLLLAAIALVGTHFLLSHPLRAPLVRVMGEPAFLGVYAVIAVATLIWMIVAYRSAFHSVRRNYCRKSTPARVWRDCPYRRPHLLACCYLAAYSVEWLACRRVAMVLKAKLRPMSYFFDGRRMTADSVGRRTLNEPWQNIRSSFTPVRRP
jgi:NnrU protein